MPIKYSDLFLMMKKAARAEIIEELVMSESNPVKSGATIKKLTEYGRREDG